MAKAGPAADDRLEIRRAADRFVTERDGITTRHSFSFGDHYDPNRVGIRSLVALNDERLLPGAGYSTHPHRGVDILTVVLEGDLRHEDSLGDASIVPAGALQRLTAGTGVTHRESNAGRPGEALRFVQLWFTLAEDVAPSYETSSLADASQGHGWSTIATSAESGPGVRLAVPGVDVAVCRLARGTGGRVLGAAAEYAETFSYVLAGDLEADRAGVLGVGDAVRSSASEFSAVATTDAVLLAVRFSSAARDR